MVQKQETQKDAEFSTQNIFDELSESKAIGEEVRELEEQQKKDIYFYLKKGNHALFSLNILIFLWLLISAAYIFIQSNTAKKEYSILEPICTFILGSNDITPWTCYPVAPILAEYKEKQQQEVQKQSERILLLLWDIYSIQNFNFSRRATFLLEKTESRLRPTSILWEFDELKSKFAPNDKSEVSCYNIIIENSSTMKLSCDIFSSDWDTEIVSLEEDSIFSTDRSGTSISRASSFIDFIESYPNSSFQVINKPSVLTSVGVQNWPYTQRTTIELELGYSSVVDLSF